MKPRLLLFTLVLIVAFTPLAGFAQTKCQPPPIPPFAGNLFTPEQEMILGDAVAAHLESNFAVIDDVEVTGYLRQIGQRLIAQMPPTKLQFQFFVVDINDMNAFTLPGGRIYVTRKMIAFAKNEDELAGVVAHELGHIVARHNSNDMSVMFRELLGVTALTDRKDIFEKYSLFIDSRNKKLKSSDKLGSREDRDQYAADLVGLYLMAGAGYDAQAQAGFWDRYHETKGKTGSFFSSLFGSTKPEQKRLGEMFKQLAMLPADCKGTARINNQAEFEKWQRVVVKYSGLGRHESISGLVAKIKLDPTLRSSVYHIRFSRDGKYLLAQDDAGISVLTRESLAPVFRINSPDAYAAQFSPDSKQVILYTNKLRVEAWSIANHDLDWANEVVVRGYCMQTALSPTGKVLACLDESAGLSLIDVDEGTSIVEKKNFTVPNIFEALNSVLSAMGPIAEEGKFINMSFTPDGHYFLAGDRISDWSPYGSYTEEKSLSFDLQERKPLAIKGDLRKLAMNGFTFVGSNKIISNYLIDGKSSIFSFPDGALLEQFAGPPAWKSAADDNFALVVGGNATGAAYNFTTKKFVRPGTNRLLDVYGGIGATETASGEIALYPLSGGEPKLFAIPENPLGRLYASEISPDLTTLAISTNVRGAVWNLDQGKMLTYVRGFRGVHFDGDGAVYLDFPYVDGNPRAMGRLDLKPGSTFTRGPIIPNSRMTQYGPVLIHVSRDKVIRGGREYEDVTMPETNLDVYSADKLEKLWSQKFPLGTPTLFPSGIFGTMLQVWKAGNKTALAEIQADPQLSQRYHKSIDSDADYYLKVLDLKTGKEMARLVVETGGGAFKILYAFAYRDALIVSDNQNRTSVYSLSNGALRGRVFGNRAAVGGNVLCVENESGQLTFYSLESLEQKGKLTFSDRIRFVRFNTDGTRMAVVTAGQYVYKFNVPEIKGI
jgi:WD40 repeat protein